MYLKQLFQHNKPWFAVVLLFILCQLFINFKRGMVVSPFYHYGMYSQVMEPQSNYPVFEVTADGKVLQTKNFTAQQWDKIMQPIIYYSKHHEWNANMFGEVHRITRISDTAKYTSNVQKKDFFDWYTRYLSGILDKEVKNIIVQQKTHSPGR